MGLKFAKFAVYGKGSDDLCMAVADYANQSDYKDAL